MARQLTAIRDVNLRAHKTIKLDLIRTEPTKRVEVVNARIFTQATYRKQNLTDCRRSSCYGNTALSVAL